MIPFIWHSGKGKTIGTENRWVVARVEDRGGAASTGEALGGLGGAMAQFCVLLAVAVSHLYYVFVKT